MELKGNVYQTVVRPALLHGAETWTTTRGQEARLEVNEMRMLRWMSGVTRRDKIRNEHIRGTTRVAQASKKISEKRLKWYGHVRRMKEEHIVRRMLDVDIPGTRRRGRSNLRWKDACKRHNDTGRVERGLVIDLIENSVKTFSRQWHITTEQRVQYLYYDPIRSMYFASRTLYPYKYCFN